MIFFRLIEIVFVVIILSICWTQIIKPALHKTSFFPYFRKQGKLEVEAIKLNQTDAEEDLAYKIEARREKKIQKGE